MDETQTTDYWFFLSYSSNDNDEDLRRFCIQLARAVRTAAALPTSTTEEEIGFRDKKEIYPGADWRQTLSKALQTSRVLLCLCSRSYFHSEYCGKEFQVFRDRVDTYAPTLPGGADGPKLIIPILWDLPRKLENQMPQAVKSIQCNHEDFGDLYSKHGLSYLMKIKEPANDVAYNKLLFELREIIVAQGSTHRMQPSVRIPSIEEAKSAFHLAAAPPVSAAPLAAAELPTTVPVPGLKGPGVTWFVYLAGRETDYVNVRENRNGYGANGGFDWQPFTGKAKGMAENTEQPAPNNIGAITYSAAIGKFQPETLLVSQQLVEHLRVAEENNTPIILVVDPWTLKLEAFTRPMCELDKNRLAKSMVLVVWNKNDEETNGAAEDLRKKLETTFERSVDSTDVFRSSISSEEDLRRELSEALETMRKKVMRNPTPKLPIEGGSGSMPTLKVPGVTPASEVPVATVAVGTVPPVNPPTEGDL